MGNRNNTALLKKYGQKATLVTHPNVDYDANNRVLRGTPVNTPILVIAYHNDFTLSRNTLPGGSRSERVMTFYTLLPISVGPPTGVPDIIIYNGIEYSVSEQQTHHDGTVTVVAVAGDV